MKHNGIYRLMMTGFMVFSVLACSGTFTSTFPAPTSSVPTEPATLPPPLTPAPTQGVTLSSISLHEENPNPAYEIKASVPALSGRTDALVANFNTAMLNLVHTEINKFKKDVSELPASSVSPGSFLIVNYSLTFQRRDLWSFKFDFSRYTAGAAHPGLYSITVTYDLNRDRELALSDLFLPNSNYLEAISKYCNVELNKRNIGFEEFSKGAAPTPENYRNWNITRDGLMITFDEYQVAAYAAGPQTVVIPYSDLQSVIDPQGPLAGLTR